MPICRIEYYLLRDAPGARVGPVYLYLDRIAAQRALYQAIQLCLVRHPGTSVGTIWGGYSAAAAVLSPVGLLGREGSPVACLLLFDKYNSGLRL
jgi:hypothetical protein